MNVCIYVDAAVLMYANNHMRADVIDSRTTRRTAMSTGASSHSHPRLRPFPDIAMRIKLCSVSCSDLHFIRSISGRARERERVSSEWQSSECANFSCENLTLQTLCLCIIIFIFA